MEKLPSPILTDVLEVISTANDSLDYGLVRQKAMDALYRIVPSAGAIFFLPDGNGQYTFIKVKNLDHAYSGYYQKHFAKFDPLNLSKALSETPDSKRTENIFSYDSFLSTEYYNDFLKPQGIHHKLVVNLVAERELHGRVVLTRPRDYNSFTSKEILTVKTVSPYLAHALAHNNLRRKVRLKGTILDYIEKQSSIGMILLDDNLQVIYSNDKAEEAVGNLSLSEPATVTNSLLPSRLREFCQEVKAELKHCPSGGAVLSRQVTIKGADDKSFTVTFRVMERGREWEGSRIFLLSIEEILSAKERSLAKINPEHLMSEFDLSKREIDVVELVFMGLKNAQIAKNIFVSEVTVKKHLQKIYEKVGVKNRTSLINRILMS